MLRSLTSRVRNADLPFGRIVTGAAAVLMSASLIAPLATHQQAQAHPAPVLAGSAGLHREQHYVYDTLVRNRLEAKAQTTLAGASATVAAYASKVDPATATTATTAVAALNGYKKLDDLQLNTTIATTQSASDTLASVGVAAVHKAAAAAAAQAAAAAAAQAQAQAQSQAQAQTVAVSAPTTSASGVQAIAASLAQSQYGWGADQFSCLSQLWQKESSWNYQAVNPSSGAAGIPQALPGSKMAAYGSDWATNPATQIKWGLSYIQSSYGTPCAAWSHSESMNWY